MDTLTISKKLLASGFKQEQAEVIATTITQAVDERNDELMTKNDGKRLEWMIGFVVVVGGAGFGYLINTINNNHDLLTVIISKLG